jgi:DNA-directed RNA polymerase specialized sigma subunit
MPNEYGELAEKVLGDLTTEDRRILELFYHDELKIEDIAAILGYEDLKSLKQKKSLILRSVGERFVKLINE